MRFIQPKIFDKAKIISAMSTRNGGLSSGYFSSLNTGRSTSDDKSVVEKNRKLFFKDLGIDESNAALSYQVHGSEILKAEISCRENGFDALFTNKKELTLIVSIADCTPILIHDPIKKVVAAIHAGWRGTVAGIVSKTIQRMKDDYGSDASDCLMWVGPCISFDSFEVGEEVANYFDGNLKRKSSFTDKYFVDLKSSNKMQGIKSGIQEKNIEVSEFCTFRDKDFFFSHRRDLGNTGRMIAIIRMI